MGVRLVHGLEGLSCWVLLFVARVGLVMSIDVALLHRRGRDEVRYRSALLRNLHGTYCDKGTAPLPHYNLSAGRTLVHVRSRLAQSLHTALPALTLREPSH
jgi:hypothetical protein